jgi:dihydroorotate dehydrogenase (fumarate)
MDLSTNYLGFELPHPFIAGAGPLADTVETAKRLEDAGAAAIVMRSLFEEQLDAKAAVTRTSAMKPEEYIMPPDKYLEQLRKIKAAVAIPVIVSLNGHTPGEWLHFARNLEQAGANAIELNLFDVANDAAAPAASVEQRAIEMVREIRKDVKIPLAVKLSPFYTSLANFAQALEEAGANGMVLFNRFFEADIDVEKLEIVAQRQLSDSRELLLRLRWLAILSSSLRSAKLAVTGGVHSAVDAIKAIMCGAAAIQMVSALLKQGPEHLSKVRESMIKWMEEKGYESLEQLHGPMNTLRTRSNYIRLLQTWQWA